MTETLYETDGFSFVLRPATNHDGLFVTKTSYFKFATPNDRLVLRTLTILCGEPVFYPLAEWRKMTEERREMIRAAYVSLNTSDECGCSPCAE